MILYFKKLGDVVMLFTNLVLVIIAFSLLGIFGIMINKERYTVTKDTVNSIKADKFIRYFK